MGTRNLTIVKSKGKVKVAQYGQWDGYPTGQGNTIAEFLKQADLKKFQKLVDKLGTYTDKEIEQAYADEGAIKGDRFVSMDIAKRVEGKHPALCRDFGAGILDLIYRERVNRVVMSEDFEKDSLFCEYCYKIDLDNETVEINGDKYSFKQWTRKGFMKKLEDKENEND